MSQKYRGQTLGDALTRALLTPANGVQMETFIPWTLVKRGVKKQVITPLDAPQAFTEEARREQLDRQARVETPLVRALGLAHYWQRLLDERRFESLTQIAAAEGMDLGQVSKIARMAFLAPAIVNACLTENCGIALEQLVRRGMPLDWRAQQSKLIGPK